MNKKYLMGFIACAALTVTSCSNDEVMDAALQQEAKAIQFSTYLGRDVETKGAELTTDGLKTQGFGVFAYYTADQTWEDKKTSATPNFMYNQKVTYNSTSSAWEYTPVKYWPTTSGDRISFFAYAPYGINAETNGFTLPTNAATGHPTVTVSYPTDLTKMVDFVAAGIANQVKTDEVSFTLKHEMTRLGIKAKVSEKVYSDSENANKTFVNIKSIKLKNETGGNFYTSGTYTFASASGTAGTWSNQNGSELSELNLSSILNTETVSVTNATEGTDYQTGVNGVQLTSSTEASILKDGNYLFLIPADESGLTKYKSSAIIAYDIVTEDSKLAAGYSCTSATKTVFLPEGILKQGTAYTVTFTINVDKIEVSAEVDAWSTPDAAEEVNVSQTHPDAQ